MGQAPRPLEIGDEVRAFGRLCFETDGTWFQPPLPVPAVFEANPRVNPHWRSAVPVAGADPDALLHPEEANGIRAGRAELTGYWTGAGLQVTGQRAIAPPLRSQPDHEIEPTCPEPGEGWPVGPLPRLPDELQSLRDSGAIPIIAVARPRPHVEVLIVTTTDRSAVESLLRPLLGQSLCIVESEHSAEEIRAVITHLRDPDLDWGVYEFGTGSTPAGQVEVQVECVRILPEMLDWASHQSPRLVRLKPWLAKADAQGTRAERP